MAVLSTLLIPKMKLSKSAIINLSSFLGENPAPYSSLYSATKAFNTYFSESVSMERGLEKIDILSVRPMFVVSPLSKQEKAFTVPGRK
jgi:17beta-estradiol 17-dehydrogenase / very-long-chain 3-oxoacyl-CoA reductase